MPDGTILASTTASITGSNISDPAWFEFAFTTTPTYVTTGTQYAIVVTTTNAQIYGTTGNAYGGGAALEWVTSKGLSYWLAFGTTLGDFSFKTYVDTAATAPSKAPSTAASPTAFQSVQGQTAGAVRSPTAPPTSTVSSGGADGGGTPLLLIAACLAAAAALVALRRNVLARLFARERAQS